MGDKWRTNTILRLGIGLILAVPLSILGLWFMSQNLPLLDPLIPYSVIFAIRGASLSIFHTGASNSLLEILKPSERPQGIGLINTLNSFSTFMPLIGGIIAGYLPLEAIFLITVIPVSTSIFFSKKLA